MLCKCFICKFLQNVIQIIKSKRYKFSSKQISYLVSDSEWKSLLPGLFHFTASNVVIDFQRLYFVSPDGSIDFEICPSPVDHSHDIYFMRFQ